MMLLGMDGNRVSVNRLVFACMSRLAGSLNQEDEENVISTELTGEDLQTVAEFLMTGRLPGQSDAQTVALFSHVGISLRGMKVVKIKVVDGQVEDNLTQDLVKSEQENYFVQQDRSRKRRVDHEEGDLSSESKVRRTESKIDSPPSSADVRQQSAVSQQDPIASSDSLTECYRNSRNLVVETDVVEAGTENDSILPQTLSNPKERTTIIDIKIEPQDILNDEFTIGELVDGVFNNREEEEEEDHDSEVEGEELRELEDWVVD